jgi:chemotaxis signal transduction protein
MNNEPFEHDDASPAGGKLQLVHAGSSQFGIFAEEISAIVSWREPTSLPHAPTSVLGVVSIQGRMLTVLDLATLPVHEAQSTNDGLGKTREHIIALRGAEQLALAIETLGEVIQLTPAEAGAESLASQGNVTTPVLATLQRDGTKIRVLNLKGLFPTAIQGRQRRQRRF